MAETIFQKPLDAQVALNTDAITNLAIKSKTVSLTSDANGNINATSLPTEIFNGVWTGRYRYNYVKYNNNLYFLFLYQYGTTSVNTRLYKESSGTLTIAPSTTVEITFYYV